MAEPETVNGKELARILGITAGRVSQLKTAGVLETTGTPPLFDLARNVQAYLAYSVDNARGRASEDEDAERKKLRADADYKEAKARQEELRLAELEGRMHSAEDVEAATEQLVYSVRSMLLALPGRVAVDAADRPAAEVSEVVRREVCAVLEDLSQYRYDPKAYAAMVRGRKGWSTDDEDGESEDR